GIASKHGSHHFLLKGDFRVHRATVALTDDERPWWCGCRRGCRRDWPGCRGWRRRRNLQQNSLGCRRHLIREPDLHLFNVCHPSRPWIRSRKCIHARKGLGTFAKLCQCTNQVVVCPIGHRVRSEERRVGKGGRGWWGREE